MTDHQVTVAEQLRVRDEAADPDVRGLGAEICGLFAGTERRDHVDRPAREAVKDDPEERQVLIPDHAERDVDGRPLRQGAEPGGLGSCARAGRLRPDGDPPLDLADGRYLQTWRARVEVERAIEPCRCRRDPGRQVMLCGRRFRDIGDLRLEQWPVAAGGMRVLRRGDGVKPAPRLDTGSTFFRETLSGTPAATTARKTTR